MAVKRSVVSMTGGAETRGQDLLHNRNFTLLSIGQAISNMGDFIYSTTLLIWVAALGGSAAAVSGVLAAQYVPIFLLGPIAGVFVDRWHRLRTMIVSDLARALLALLPLCAPEALRLPSIYGSVFLISAISRFFMPARSAVTQVIVTREQQAQAASVGQVTQALSVIVGPGLASPLYFAVGPVVAILVNAASFVLSALCLWYMRVPKANLLPAAFKSQTGSLEQVETSRGIRAIFDEMLAGFGLVLKTRLLLLVTILGMIAMFGAGAINSLEIIYVSQRLHAGPGLYGYLAAVSGLGALIGAICIGLLVKHLTSRMLLAGSLVLLGLGIVIYALQTRFVLALILSFLLSVPQGGINVGMAPLIMGATPRRFMGRVQSVLNTATYGASLLAIALSGWLGTFVPAYLILVGGGILMFVSGIFGWLVLPTTVPVAEEAVVAAQEELPVPVKE